MGKIVNKAELAEILGKSERTLTTWQKNGMPIEVDGGRGSANKYCTEAIISWMVRREIDQIIQGQDGEGGAYNYDSERARLTHHQANKTALEEQVLGGALIPAETVAMVQTKMLGAFRAKCLSIPTKTAPRVVYLTDLAETEGELRNAIYDALSELSEFRPEQYGITIVRDDCADDSTATEPDC